MNVTVQNVVQVCNDIFILPHERKCTFSHWCLAKTRIKLSSLCDFLFDLELISPLLKRFPLGTKSFLMEKNTFQKATKSSDRVRSLKSIPLEVSLKCLNSAYYFVELTLTLLLLNTTCPVLANSVDPDQLASEALFVIKYVNFYQNPRSSNLIGWKLEVGVASYFIQHEKD